MNMLTSLIKHHAVVFFCTLTIALTFAVTLLPLPGQAIPIVMVFIPALTAITLTAFTKGKAGVKSLLAKLIDWRIGLKWVVIALALGLVIRLTMSIIALGLGMIATIQIRPGGPVTYIVLALVFFVFAIPEELGWRGYALPKLLERYSALTTGLIVGTFWGSLHLALLLPGMMNEGAPPVPTVLALVGGSVLFTWLYVNSGSIVLTTIFHAAQSFFAIVNDGIPIAQQAWLLAGVYSAAALIVVMMAGSGLSWKSVAGMLQGIETTQTSDPLAQK